MAIWKWAVRGLRRSPGFTAAGVATLGLGIGSAVLVFAVLYSVVLRPLPFPDPDRLTFIWIDDAKRGVHEEGTGYPTYADWRAQAKSFEDVAVRGRGYSGTLTGGEPERVLIDVVSANYLPLLGVVPVAGRLFTPQEEDAGALTAVISDRLAVQRFGNVRSVAGQTLEIDGAIWRVAGVIPARKTAVLGQQDVWVPAKTFPPLARFMNGRSFDFFMGIGRLRKGVEPTQAQAELNTIGHQLAKAYPIADPGFGGYGTSVVPISEQVLGRRLPRLLWLLMGAVLLVFLIACVNIANLLLARGASRQGETAIRAALGAGMRSLVAQQMAEGMVLSALGGAAGFALAYLGLLILPLIAPVGLPRFDELGMPAWVAVFAVFTSGLSCLLFGVVPAWIQARRDPNEGLRGGGNRTTDRGAGRLQGWLVVCDFALALVLVSGAALLLRSLLAIERTDPGYRTKDVVLFQVDRSWGQSREQHTVFYEELFRRLRRLPGVEAAGAITDFFIERNPDYTVTVKGRPTVVNEQVTVDATSTGFLQAAGARFIRGRSLDGSDNRFPPTTLVINETFAKRFFGNEDPIGKLLKFGTAESKEPWITVVGVVADLHRQGLEKHAVCEGFGPLINPSMDVIVRGSLPAAALTPGVRSVIRELDPRAPVYGITTLGDRLEQFTADRRMESWLLGGFSSLTLLLAAVGIYGVLQYVVAQRRREIAIRIALGADNRRIFDSVLRRGLAQAALGIIAGLTAALALARVTSSLLYGVSPLDPISYGVSCGVLAAVAAAACWLPARTAARTDPAELLRE